MPRAYLAQVETTDPKGWHTVHDTAADTAPTPIREIVAFAFDSHATEEQRARLRAGETLTVYLADRRFAHPSGAPSCSIVYSLRLDVTCEAKV